ncbi:DUF7504 family protein [Halarchaeum sp. P4]|uniref:DUF7504 family protein n=1 Tax=Halarchaeum sp. P4 TaxID=3421639 RepID=UPI003EB981A3
MQDGQTHTDKAESQSSSKGQQNLTRHTRRALRDAQYIERELDEPADQIVIATDDLDYAWAVALAFLAHHEVRDRAGSSVVTTERDADLIEADFEEFLPDHQLGVLDIDSGQQAQPYRTPPVYTLSNVGDFTSLFLTIDKIHNGFDGDASLIVHSLDDLLAETSVQTVTRLLKLFEWRLSATPQLFTLDLERCSEQSLENVQSMVDTLVRIEGAPDETWVTVE